MFFTRTKIEAEVNGETIEVRALSYGVLKQLRVVVQPLVPALAALNSKAVTKKSKFISHRDEKLVPIEPEEGTESAPHLAKHQVLHRQSSDVSETEPDDVQALEASDKRRAGAIEKLLEALLGDANALLLVRMLVDSFPAMTFPGIGSWKEVTREQAEAVLADIDLGTLAQLARAMWQANQASLAPLGKLLAGSAASQDAEKGSESSEQPAT